MYIRTKQAACWVDGTSDVTQTRAPRQIRLQRWAEHPLRTPHGLARAIRFDGEDVRVLVENNGRRHWMPIDLAMDEAQARRWIRTGFGRGR